MDFSGSSAQGAPLAHTGSQLSESSFPHQTCQIQFMVFNVQQPYLIKIDTWQYKWENDGILGISASSHILRQLFLPAQLALRVELQTDLHVLNNVYDT